jgi:hypothetical protein
VHAFLSRRPGCNAVAVALERDHFGVVDESVEPAQLVVQPAGVVGLGQPGDPLGGGANRTR